MTRIKQIYFVKTRIKTDLQLNFLNRLIKKSVLIRVFAIANLSNPRLIRQIIMKVGN